MNLPLIIIALAATVEIQLSDWQEQLTDAVAYNNLSELRVLLKAGNNPNFEDTGGATPLIHAVLSQDPAIVEALIKAGADVNFKTQRGDTALWVAAFGSKPKIVKLLLSKGADPNHANVDGSTPLISAVGSGNVEKAKMLLRAGAKVNAQSTNGSSALIVAAEANHLKIIDLLLDSGADPNLTSTDFHTALYFAVVAKNSKVVRDLLQKSALVCTNLPSGALILETATKSGDTIQTLIKRHARTCPAGGKTQAAATPETNPSQKPAKPEELSWKLQAAIEQRSLIDAERLLKQGADPNFRSAALFYDAIKTGDPKIVSLLLNHGAKVNGVAPTQGITPLALAASESNEEMVKLLLDSGADPNPAVRGSMTPILSAIHSKTAANLELLLERGANVNVTNEVVGNTALIIACSKGTFAEGPKKVRLLLSHGADVNVINAHGETALFEAVRRGNPEIVEALLKANARTDIKNRQGYTVLDLAKRRPEILRLLEQHQSPAP